MKSCRITFVAALAFGVAAIMMQPAFAQTAPAPSATDQDAEAEPIGNVATLQGNATVTRNKTTAALKLQDDIFENDVLQTSANSTLGVTFSDETTFNLTANSRIVVDNFVYENGAKNNSAVFNVTRGTVAFVAAAVAKTGDMKISTPTATLGIRGTTGLVEVPDGAAPGAPSANNVGIKLYPDADGRVGHIDVTGRDGTRLGSLTQGSTGFFVRPGAGGRFTATPIQISPQQAARDRGIVRQVHATRDTGRRIVTQQRALRQQQNPQRQQPGARQPNPRQPGLQQPGRQQRGLQQPGLQQRPPALPNAPQRAPNLQSPNPQRPNLQQPGQQRPPGVRTQTAPRPLQGLPRPARQAAPKQKPPPGEKPRRF